MIENYFQGIGYYSQSIPLAFDRRFVRYFVYVGIIGLLLGLVLVGGVGYTGWDAYQDIYTKWGQSEGILSKAGLMMKEILPLFLMLLIAFVMYKNIVLIVSGPILSFLSAKVDQSVTGRAEDLSGSIPRQIQRTIRFSIWSSLREILFTLLCLPLNFIPGIGSIAATILIFAIQSYYAGANYMDFILERRGFGAKEGIALIRSNKVFVTGIGSGFILLLMIPFLGFILAPTAAVIAATLGFIQKIKE
ncbi:MAG: EI24 domain-containing protein [Bacteroidia bacterium]|nr:EI24 domain-containing protein [Bacteroidia bacterium]